MANSKLLLLQAVKSDSRWLDAHFAQICQEHEGEFIAVKNKGIVCADRNFDLLLSKLKKQGTDAGSVLVHFITKSKRIFE